ncbi:MULTISPECIES: uroporphyrinogen-III C-methyltransferase [Rhodopseudomonas]|uniref:uroporphyrinogen-III C-methyltransferase n=1 Tax=Rhodopseudomonas palustris TaxID=1076 RepID=A0A0D7E079_RHOPL|nr:MULTISPECIES: uroporphyrinogen-III C-methyltransferase [Rhodopseudomonas]KIZ33875.1 uroporphyrin-III methyltransferase [Rhodopseudomonas palustris]MDF3814488.1 uroporphyrinogen-III C-methyltransferase [Rhodopseudomonas sp. BAL398]WOK18850.1 uroporphyrinogen-III C-methyltransferase [Rhodopseudomonas sp. BAL398]
MSNPDGGPIGSIALVGAGPGDIDLLTLRAVERLRAADVILYDDLAGDALLSFARADAELIAVGKRAGHPSPKQSELNRLMIGYAQLGKRVVRVKAGDPAIFARADEEICAARDAGVPIEIVPGITTASAAAAYLGASLTKRSVARRVQMVTGHDVGGALPADLDIAALADPGATTCVFMGKATFPALAEKLMARGLSPQTSTVVVESLGTATPKVIAGSLREIAARLAAEKPHGPCLILYGAAMADAERRWA